MLVWTSWPFESRPTSSRYTQVPPNWSVCSKMMTSWPAASECRAADKPAAPAPMIATRFIVCAVAKSYWLGQHQRNRGTSVLGLWLYEPHACSARIYLLYLQVYYKTQSLALIRRYGMSCGHLELNFIYETVETWLYYWHYSTYLKTT